jgi:hypothetical protein
MSLILTNGHPAISTPRPLAPGFKEIGGIHIPISGPEPLPVDLQNYLDSHGRDGVIYFSLGSQINPSTIPSQVFAALYRAFEQVPQQILWKCIEGRMPPLPGNVKCIEWAPQLSVLCTYYSFCFRAGLNAERSLSAKVTEGYPRCVTAQGNHVTAVEDDDRGRARAFRLPLSPFAHPSSLRFEVMRRDLSSEAFNPVNQCM